MAIADRERLFAVDPDGEMEIGDVIVVELIANTKKQAPHVEIIIKPQMFGGST